MNKERLFNLLSSGIIAGFILGLAIALHDILVASYLQYGMLRLVNFILRDRLNIYILSAAGTVAILYIFWILLAEKIKLSKKLTAGLITILGIALFTDRIFRTFTPFTLLSGTKRLAVILGNSITGVSESGFSYMFNTLQRYGAFCIVLFICFTIFIIVGWRVIKMGRKRILSRVTLKYIRRGAFILVAFVALLNLVIAVDAGVNAPKGPNVIILLSDSLRRDHMGLYGYGRDTTPNIDRFAKDCVVFKNAISQCSWTSPAVASLFTSLYSSVHGVISHRERKADCLNHKLVTIAEALKEKGFQTAAFIASPQICKGLLWDQGFDKFKRIATMDVFLNAKPRASELNRLSLEWIAKNKGKPFFVYIHYMDTHYPYIPPQPYDSAFKSDVTRKMNTKEASAMHGVSGKDGQSSDLSYYIDKYDGEILYMDHMIGQFLGELKRYGLADNTVIVVTSDHGEGFFEHGFCGHGHTLYNEEIDIPLIIKVPESIGLKGAVYRKVGLIDILPSIMHVIGSKFSYYDINGINILDSSVDTVPKNRAIFSELDHKITLRAIKKFNYKAIYAPSEEKVELYDFENDPRETDNIVESYSEKSDELQEEIDAWQKQRGLQKKALGLKNVWVTIEDEKRIEQLRALGYLQ
ncbi:MAG: sulfatase-like hydrolase/transferase [Omnitrophica bacterium]|nr:sulfatase-like hydrolase/transferase [Candidatus Omnitrophota bacterium]